MVVDYDLVVVGGTLEAREAAWLAAQSGARVALVAADTDWASGLQPALTAEVLRSAVLKMTALTDGWLFRPEVAPSWVSLRHRLELAQTIAYPHLSYHALREGGIDGVMASGQFSPRPRLAFTTGDRRFTARAYLIATGGQPRVPAIPGLEPESCMTPASLFTLEAQPQRLIVLGRGGEAVATAQVLARLGSEVILVTRGERLLPGQDGEVGQFAIALLQAAGVQVQLNTEIEAAQPLPPGVHLTTAGNPLKADGLVLATGQVPDLHTLNLERVLPKLDGLGLAVDPQLRSRHRQIYGCGAVLGGARDAHLARHEIRVAVHNALYLPRRRVNYRTIPQYWPTVPAIASVGLSETQAQQYYGTAVLKFTLSLNKSLKAHLQGDPSGLCKLIVHKNGEILGAHWVGPEAEEVIQAVALIMAQNIRCQQLDRVPALPHTFTELLRQAAQQWQQQRWQPGCWRRDWSENWFNWRRTRQ